MLRCARRRQALQRPQREERGGGITWRPPAYSLLDQFYLERETTRTSGDLPYITLVNVLAKPCYDEKSQSMHAGRIEEADAIARRVRNIITRKSSSMRKEMFEGHMGKSTASDPRR